MAKIRLALISAYDKTGIADLAKALAEAGVKILSTGGTLRAISEAGVDVTAVDEHTGFPEMMDGRVKTLHPKIHGGLLALRGSEDHMAQAAEHDVEMIDLVVCNLYPFEATIAQPGVSVEEAIERIDVGGPSMIRSASKNFQSVTVICNPARYEQVLAEMAANDGETTYELRRDLALEAFKHTAKYDAAISNYLAEQVRGDSDDVFPPVRRSVAICAMARIPTNRERSTWMSAQPRRASRARFSTTTSRAAGRCRSTTTWTPRRR